MNAKDAMFAKEIKEKGRETKKQATIAIKKKKRKHEMLGRLQERRRNFQIEGQSSLTLLL